MALVTLAASAFVGSAAGAPSRSIAPPRFDAAAAMHWLDLQLAYGPRPAGSRALRALALRLRAGMPRARFQPFGRRLRNIVAVVPGRNPGRVVVVGAHYDTKDLPGYVGANNGAAGTAVVLQLARSLRPGELAATVVFILFDGEESPGGVSRTPAQFLATGLRGSKVAARRYRHATAMVLLDFVGQRHLRLLRDRNSNPALWARLRAAATAIGTATTFPPGGAPYGVLDDDIPFAREGVPSIDLTDMHYRCWFRACDDRAQISRRSLRTVGETVLELLHGL